MSASPHWLNALGRPFCASFRLMHCSNKVLLDHLVGECEQIGRNGNAQGFGMEVDFQLKYAAVKNVVSFDPSGRSTAGRRCSWSKAK